MLSVTGYFLSIDPYIQFLYTQFDIVNMRCAVAFPRKAVSIFHSAILLAVLSSNASAIAPSVIYSPIVSVICQILRALLGIVALLAAVVFVYAGVIWVSSRDDPGKRKEALSIMTHCIIGLIAVLIARAVISNVVPTVVGHTCGPLTHPGGGGGTPW